MTRIRWEYASLLWTSRMRNITRSDPEYQRLSADVQQQWERHGWADYPWVDNSYSLRLPSAADEDIRHAWSTGEAHYRVLMVDILNELGADGWEVVSHIVRSSAIGSFMGRDTAGYPISTQTLLKRAIA